MSVTCFCIALHIFVKLYIRKILTKELSLRTNSDFLIPKSLQPNVVKLFKTMNSVRSNNQSLKFQRFTPSGCKDIELEIRKFESTEKTQFLCKVTYYKYE